ncbi:MAG: hypothetical protein U7126_16900 [Microcoleus sp.]
MTSFNDRPHKEIESVWAIEPEAGDRVAAGDRITPGSRVVGSPPAELR